MARTMITRMGGRERWARAQALEIVEEVHRPASSGGHRTVIWRSLMRPSMSYRGVASAGRASDGLIERTFHRSAAGGWDVVGGVTRVHSQEETQRWLEYWPRNIYVMYGRLAREDSTLRLQTVSPRRFAVSDVRTRVPLGEFEVSEDGSIVRWSTAGGGESEEWIYGPPKAFGDLRMPDWGARISDGYRFYYRSVELRASDSVPFFRSESAPALVLRGATVIDGSNAPPQRNRTVIIQGDNIVGIGGPEMTTPPHAETVDVTGKYIIPGLCDAHVHFSNGAVSFNRFLANGVTCVREMWGDTRQVVRWRAGIDSGTISGPRILDVSSGFADSRQPVAPEPVVDSAARIGATFIKIGDHVERTTYDRLLRVARARGLHTVGHLPYAVSAIDAANLGQRSIEHASRLPFDVARGGDTLRAAMARAETVAGRYAVLAAVVAQYDSTFADVMAASLSRSGVPLSPTLVGARRLAFRNDSSFDADPRLRHIPDSVRARWRRATTEGRLDTMQLRVARAMYQRQRDLVRLLHRRGVPILAGSDAGDTYTYDGSSLHDEMVELARAGLPPRDVLHAATRNVAEVAGAIERLGTVSVGKLADLVILDADPLADVANVRRIHAVVRGGRLLRRPDLERMLR